MARETKRKRQGLYDASGHRHPESYRVRRIQGDLLRERPEGMSYEEYREARKEQAKQIRGRLRGGFMVWKSRCAVAGQGESWGQLVGRVPAIVFED